MSINNISVPRHTIFRLIHVESSCIILKNNLGQNSFLFFEFQNRPAHFFENEIKLIFFFKIKFYPPPPLKVIKLF